MFQNIPDILPAKKLLDRALQKSKKIKISDRDSRYRYKKSILARTESIGSYLANTLKSYVHGFPTIDNLHPFYKDLLNLQFSIDEVKQALGALQWAHRLIESIISKQLPFIKRTLNQEEIHKKYREILGRLFSIIHQIENQLQLLMNVVIILKKMPEIQKKPSVVIAGYPNVGKSSLLRLLSNAKPEIAQYPFTTQQIYVGHILFKNRYENKVIQVIDTPGLLDRCLTSRNNIEKKAIAALQHLADLIVFLTDPTQTSGYGYDEQRKLLTRIENLFSEIPIIIVENKADIHKTNSTNLKISCLNNEGIEELKQNIIHFFK